MTPMRRPTRLPPRRLARVPALALALAALTLSGCGWVVPKVDDPGEAVGGPPAVAELLVEGWLDRVSRGDGNLGWSLLYPALREDLFGGEAAYRASVAGADWTGFRWSLEGTSLRDGEYQVRLAVAGEATAIDGFLVDWGVVQVLERGDGGAGGAGGAAAHGFITVRLGTGGEPSGIQALGPG